MTFNLKQNVFLFYCVSPQRFLRNQLLFDTWRAFWWRWSITVQLLSFFSTILKRGSRSHLCCVGFSPSFGSLVRAHQTFWNLMHSTIPQNDYDLCCPGKTQLCNCPFILCKRKDTITQLAFWGVRIGASCERNQMKRLLHPPFSSEVGGDENGCICYSWTERWFSVIQPISFTAVQFNQM